MLDFLAALQEELWRIAHCTFPFPRIGGDPILQCDTASKIRPPLSMETPFGARGRGSLWVAAIAFAMTTNASQAADNAPTKGKAKAEAQCNVCHGANGMSKIPNAPHLAGQPEIYLVEQLKNYRSGKRANEVMAVLAKPLSDEDIANLAAWYASIEIKATPKT